MAYARHNLEEEQVHGAQVSEEHVKPFRHFLYGGHYVLKNGWVVGPVYWNNTERLWEMVIDERWTLYYGEDGKGEIEDWDVVGEIWLTPSTPTLQ